MERSPQPSAQVENDSTLTVAVAANFISPMRTLAVDFEAETGIALKLVFGSSGQLFAQTQNGAPFDVFLSADEAKPLALERAGSIVDGSRRTYALGQIVLWQPGVAFTEHSHTEGMIEYLRARLSQGRLAVANPRLAPYGAATMELLEKLNSNQTSLAQIVYGENIAQTFHFVVSGNVEAGFVALSQLYSYDEKYKDLNTNSDALLIPQHMHVPIKQQMVILSSTENPIGAMQLQNWLLSTPIQARIKKMGSKI